nr:hypothetical protein [Tanacetum cinerariifolium]
MENVPPLNNNPNVPEEELILDQAPAALVGFTPQWIEEIKDEDMVNDEEDDAEIADVDDVPIPPVIQFGTNFHIKESSTMRDLLTGNSKEEPFIYTALVPRADDPYVMVRDAAMDTQGDEDVDTDAPWDTQPFEPRGSPRDSQ